MSIEPVSSADKGKLADTLNALAREDPTFTYKVNEETGQTLISGMGELHLEILKNRMIRDYKLKVHVGRPRVSYRETIKKAVKRVAGDLHPPDRRLGAVRQGHDRPRARDPAQGGAGARASSTSSRGASSPPSSSRRSRPACARRPSPAAGPATRWSTSRSRSSTATTHDVDSNDLAFRFAASDALRKAVHEAGAVLLEPIMKLEVVTPEDYLGNITADLSSRRALIDQHLHPRQADGHRGPGPAGEDVRLLDRRPQPQPGPPATPWSPWNTPPPPTACSKASPGCRSGG